MSRRHQLPADAPHVIIVGAGFAGFNAVEGLERTEVRVTLIDQNLYSTFQPLLYQVATGGLNPGDVAYPVGAFTGRHHARYIRGDLASIDPAGRLIKLGDGRQFSYDYLVLATGVSAAYYGVKGAAENTFELYTRRDAIVLRDHIMAGYERLSADDGDGDGAGELAVTVVGGGATGVELAGTLAELRGTVLRATFPDVDPSRVRVRLVEMAPELLMPFHPKLRAYTRRQLEKRRVEIHLSTRILAVEPGKVVLGDGESRHSDLTVWAAGVAAAEGVSAWNLPQGQNGRILVGPDLRVQGSDRIFAIGDIGLCTPKPSPQLAQPAIQQGKHAARQIRRLLNGEPTEPFSYHDKGIMATIGRSAAVVQLARGLRITGFLAWLAWLGLHLIYLLGNRNRVSTLINLSWRYIAWGHGGSVIVGDEPASAVPAAEPSDGSPLFPTTRRSRVTDMTSRARVVLAAGALAVFAALSGCASGAGNTSGSA
jgi:NADH:ubiquinone reductase (H+-translocating)